MRKHETFILKPMSSVVEEAVLSVAGMGASMESYPSCSYIRDALMLRLTGFQEQKLKCIMWEMATDDYEFRYRYVLQKSLGECSNAGDKQDIFKHIIGQIREKAPNYSLSDDLRDDVVNNVKNVMETAFNGTMLKSGSDREFRDYLDISRDLTRESFGVDRKLFCGTVGGLNAQDFYANYLYRQRNRLAHNAASYQENIPGFAVLADPNDRLRNYFLFYAYLMMMDGVFVEAFKKYLTVY